MKTIELMKQRRSIYGIGKNQTLSNGGILSVIKEAVQHSPSAFNSQTPQAIVLFGQHSADFWDIAMEALRKVVPEGSFKDTENKINSFKGGYGTVLFFEDTKTIQDLENNFPLYAHNFKAWGEQALGITQFAVWTALAELGIGASLQHYTELIEKAVKEKFNVPANWRLAGQMPFGSIEAPAGAKEFLDINQRVLVFE